MSVIDQAYLEGRAAAFEKFAMAPAPVRMSGPMPVPMPPAARPAAPAAAPAAAPGMMQRAWGGLNKLVAHPMGSLGLSIAAPLALSSMMSPSQPQQ